MAPAKAISAKQAAQAIVLLHSKHDTASNYLHAMDGEEAGMSRAEFKEYLRISSQDEYLELVRGHLPEECATLVRKAFSMQEKRTAEGRPLTGLWPSDEVAEQFHGALQLMTSQGLPFKAIQKALSSFRLPDSRTTLTSKGSSKSEDSRFELARIEPPHESPTPPSRAIDNTELRVSTTTVADKQVEKHGESSQQRATQNAMNAKERKEERQRKQAEKIKMAKKAKKARQGERRKKHKHLDDTAITTCIAEDASQKRAQTLKPATTHPEAATSLSKVETSAQRSKSTSSGKNKKRKHDALSPPIQAHQPIVATATDQAGNKFPGYLSGQRNQSGPPTKKQKATRPSSPCQLDDGATQTAQDHSYQESDEISMKDNRPRKRKKNDRRFRRRVKIVPQEQETGPRQSRNFMSSEDAGVTPVELAVPDTAPAPAPIQETAEFVSAVEAEESFNSSRSHSTESKEAHIVSGYRAGRTLLPIIKTKKWSPESSVPQMLYPPAEDATAVKLTRGTADSGEEIVSMQGHEPLPFQSPEMTSRKLIGPETTFSTSHPTQTSRPTSPPQALSEESMAQLEPESNSQHDIENVSTDVSSEDSLLMDKKTGNEKDGSPASVPAAMTPTMATSKIPSLSASQPVPTTGTPLYSTHNPSQQQPAKPSDIRKACSQKKLETSGRASLRYGYMPTIPTFESLRNLRPMQPKTTSVPNHHDNYDPKIAFANLNRFLNGGNSSEESDDDTSSSSSSDDETLPKARPRPAFVVNEQSAARTSAWSSQAELATSTSRLPQEVNKISSPDDVTSFGSFHGNAVQPTSRLQSLSPEIPDLPSLMDQGGYAPTPSSTECPAPDVPSGVPIGFGGKSMDTDTPKPHRNGTREEGIVRPSDIVDGTSSSPRRSASATMEDEAHLEMPYDVKQGTGASEASSARSYVSSDRDQMQIEDVEFVSEDAGDPCYVNGVLAQTYRPCDGTSKSRASSPVHSEGEHHTDDDQIMASSQLLGATRAESPPLRGEHSSQQIDQEEHFSTYNGDHFTARQDLLHAVPKPGHPQVVVHRSPKDELSRFLSISGDGTSGERRDDSVGGEYGGDRGPLTPSEYDGGEGNEKEDHKDERGDSDGHSLAEQTDEKSSEGPEFSLPDEEQPEQNKKYAEAENVAKIPDSERRKKAKATGTTSRHVSVTPEKTRSKRVPAGTSSVPFPKLTAPRFGLIQETLWQNPFQMLCAVLFLNKTKGQVAKDIIVQVLDRWPTPKALSKANSDEVIALVETLGLQNERTRKLIKLAEVFVEDPPRKSRRHRTLNYPHSGDGKTLDDGSRSSPGQIVEQDSDEISGFLEIGHLYGAGPYAWDSWRIFCRDVLRGVAEGYNGEGVEGYHDGEQSNTTFEPEWKRVIPKDKELRACLRWMWLREGWDWDPLTGQKVPASVNTLREASQGIAEWNEPDKYTSHGVEIEDVDEGSKYSQDVDALVAGLKAGDVIETIEQQSVRGDPIEEVSKANKVTRRSWRASRSAGPSKSGENARDSTSRSQQSIRALRSASRQIIHDKAGSSTLLNKIVDQPTVATTRRRRVVKDVQPSIAGRANDNAGEAAQHTVFQDLPSGLPFPTSAPLPTRMVLDSPAGNTRQRSARAVESQTLSSPPPATRARPTRSKLRHAMMAKMTEESGKCRSSRTNRPFFPIFHTKSRQNFKTMTCAENLKKIKKDLLSSFPIFPNITTGPSVVSNATSAISCNEFPSASLLISLPGTSGLKQDEKESDECYWDRTRHWARNDDGAIVVKPPPGFFNATYDKAWGHVHLGAKDEAYMPTIQEEKLKNHQWALHHEISEHWGQPVNALIDLWNLHGSWPADVKLLKLRDDTSAAQKMLVRNTRHLNRRDPNYALRERWQRIYPQDLATAVEQASRLQLDREWPREDDKQRHAMLRKTRDLSTCATTSPDMRKGKRQKRKCVKGPYPWRDEEIRRRKRGIDELDWRFENPVEVAPGKPWAMFALKVLWWEHELTLEDLTLQGRLYEAEERREEAWKAEGILKAATRLQVLGRLHGDDQYVPVYADLKNLLREDDWEDFERQGFSAIGSSWSWLMRDVEEVAEFEDRLLFNRRASSWGHWR